MCLLQKKIPITLNRDYFCDPSNIDRCSEFLNKVPDGYPIHMEEFGTGLMAFICMHCVVGGSWRFPALQLIHKGCGVNELTAHGTPLSHMLYIMASHLLYNADVVRKYSFPIIDSLLNVYSPHVVVRKGQALDPKEADRLHGGIRQDSFLEYGEDPLLATLVVGNPSQELYNKVKEVVDLTHINGFKRNFLHHLAIIPSAFETDLQGLFFRRKLSLDQIRTLLNQKDVEGMTPLMYAAKNPEMLIQLMNLGADYEAVDQRGFSIRHHLFLMDDEMAMRLFLNFKGEVLNGTESMQVLRKKCVPDLNAPVSLGVSFKDQVKNLVMCDKSCFSMNPGVNERVLSTHQYFAQYFFIPFEICD